ncbi:hypothetical protein [Undibacterium flavidum]|uniref:Uncharacterized protein n=1 Tax=Undibacterium flavidum TaxID=2762297 RepID=A0ABR6YDK8_9BURK|nr:hypothetical protein [Undibacterium flavidum]MBC3874644.1 hypothetical protein [Undibacterium flavidum]
MSPTLNIYLLFAAALSVLGALLHFACLVFGAPLFRLLGAGEVVVKMLERGHSQPKVIAVLVGTALLISAAYASSAAGLIISLPWQRLILIGVTAVLFARALAFPFLKPLFVGNSDLFWWISSGLCFVFASLIAIGQGSVNIQIGNANAEKRAQG